MVSTDENGSDKGSCSAIFRVEARDHSCINPEDIFAELVPEEKSNGFRGPCEFQRKSIELEEPDDDIQNARGIAEEATAPPPRSKDHHERRWMQLPTFCSRNRDSHNLNSAEPSGRSPYATRY